MVNKILTPRKKYINRSKKKKSMNKFKSNKKKSHRKTNRKIRRKTNRKIRRKTNRKMYGNIRRETHKKYMIGGADTGWGGEWDKYKGEAKKAVEDYKIAVKNSPDENNAKDRLSSIMVTLFPRGKGPIKKGVTIFIKIKNYLDEKKDAEIFLERETQKGDSERSFSEEAEKKEAIEILEKKLNSLIDLIFSEEIKGYWGEIRVNPGKTQENDQNIDRHLKKEKDVMTKKGKKEEKAKNESDDFYKRSVLPLIEREEYQAAADLLDKIASMKYLSKQQAIPFIDMATDNRKKGHGKKKNLEFRALEMKKPLIDLILSKKSFVHTITEKDLANADANIEIKHTTPL